MAWKKDEREGEIEGRKHSPIASVTWADSFLFPVLSMMHTYGMLLCKCYVLWRSSWQGSTYVVSVRKRLLRQRWLNILGCLAAPMGQTLDGAYEGTTETSERSAAVFRIWPLSSFATERERDSSRAQVIHMLAHGAARDQEARPDRQHNLGRHFNERQSSATLQ